MLSLNGRKTLKFAKEKKNLPRTTNPMGGRPYKVSISRCHPEPAREAETEAEGTDCSLKSPLTSATVSWGHVTCFDSSHRSQ